jgi:hypothetical protein
MPVFISYSHSDATLVNTLAAHLVKHNASVWIDTWELNVGDSIVNKVQDAIDGACALLVILSKASVQSEWCKKELSAGLMRELDEKRVVVLPVIVEDCTIPIFLREKMYADLRHDFDSGLRAILDAIGSVTNANQSRLQNADVTLDWAVDWSFVGDLFELRFTIIQSSTALPMTFLTTIQTTCNDEGTRRYLKYQAAGLDWMGRIVIANCLEELGKQEAFRIILDDQFPKRLRAAIGDPKRGIRYEVLMESRKLGQDNGKDQVVNISDYLVQIGNYLRSVTRKPTKDEFEKLLQIVGAP